MGKIIQREWVDTKVAEMFYRVVLQAVGLFGLESWAVLAAMEKTVEGAHTGFLHQIMKKWTRQIKGRMCVPSVVGEVWESVGTQL